MHASTKTFLWFAALPVMALAACTAHTGPDAMASGPAMPSAKPAPGGVMWGTAIATMADQYDRAHAGPYSGTGASMWVPPPPPPAFVDTSPPPPRTPDPAPPAAVANRQPVAALAPDAASLPRVEASGATPAPAPAVRPAPAPVAAVASAASIAQGKKIFANNGCGGCHTLADAGASGGIGPSFDRNPGLAAGEIVSTVHDGRGAMPSFAGQITDPDIRALAAYIIAARK